MTKEFMPLHNYNRNLKNISVAKPKWIEFIDYGSKKSIDKFSKNFKLSNMSKIIPSPFLLIVTFVIFLTVLYHILTYETAEQKNIYQALVMKDVNFPVHNLNSEQSSVTVKNLPCTHFNCFNIYKCRIGRDKPLVYVYPPENFIDLYGHSVKSGPMSKEFYQILVSIISSKLYTPNPTEACVFVPSIDTLNQNYLQLGAVSQALKSLRFWNNGENHIIFNMISGVSPDFNRSFDIDIGKAIIVGASFSTLTYRTGFDISLPIPGTFSEVLINHESLERSRLLVFSHMNINEAFYQPIIEISSAYPKDVLVLGPCLHHNPMISSIRCSGQQIFRYPDILQTFKFCLIVQEARLVQRSLLDALATGCIPVIISDSIIMPFQEIIDWKRSAVFIREKDILSVVKKLKNISIMKIEKLQKQSLWIWNRYFKSIESIIETTFEILSERIFGQSFKDYYYWNVPAEKNLNPPLPLSTIAPKTHGFTAVILTYDRIDLLFSLINKIVEVPSLTKILIVWNNLRKNPPDAKRWPKLSKPVEIIRAKENKLSNRFYPYDEIETEAILSIDDDIIMLTPDELEFAYEVWREFPDRIVGFPSRTHTWDHSMKTWKYESEWTNRISMVLTGAAFHHKYWSYYYTTSMPGDIKHWVDEHMNCEDIAMNFLVANSTGKAPIKVTPKKKFRCPKCTNTEMLSADLAHMAERTDCINHFSRVYNTMPLKSVEFRADPVLFRDVFPEKLKRFNGIGSL